MKIAIAQINPVIGDFDHNFNKIKSFSEAAVKRGCDLVVFSELAVTGYPPRDLLEKEDFIDAGLSCLDRLVASVSGIGVIVGFVDRNRRSGGNPLFNVSVLFENGRIIRRVNKRLLPTYDVFDERRYFEPGIDCSAFDYKGRRLGLCICEDTWNDEEADHSRIYSLDPVAAMMDDNADLLINISASPFHMGKERLRTRMLSAITRRHGVPLVFANQVGGNDSVLFDGLSSAFNENGELIARARDFEEDLVVFNLGPTKGKTEPGEIRSVSTSEVESVYRALVMGTRDYARKCGFTRGVIGLSGGIDSALTATIATDALGPENILTVFMPSCYTSRQSREGAQEVARNLGVPLRIVPIENIFTQFLKIFGAPPQGAEPGIVEENLQARIRGTVLMAFSNRDQRLVLTTGNKSELSVGYCTLYGDMTGGLAVLSDVPKTLLYDICRFINRKEEIIPGKIMKRKPSAELKPNQSDEDEIPPYALLDPMLKGYIEERKGAGELIAMGYERKLVKEVIRRVEKNEYKRQQAPPGLRITSKAFGYGRRYPIAHRYEPRDI